MNNGFIRVAAAIPELRVADCDFNVARIADLVRQGEEEKAHIRAITAGICIKIDDQRYIT